MVDWKSPAELQADAAAFNNLIHALLGLYIWEFVTSLDFEWSFISGKKRFKWPLIFYFAGRYSLLFTLIGVTIALNVRTEINCQALYIFNQVFGNSTVGLVSINLSIRTMAVWSKNRYVVSFLILVILGHWSILLRGILVKAAWIEGACVITYTNNKIFALSFVYSMIFDFTVLCLTAWKLASPANGQSKLIKLIFGDGLIYFLIAFIVNTVATIFMLLDLNVIMSIIANVPAATISTIVASRVVRRLTNFSSSGPEVFSTTLHSTLAFRIPPSSHRISVKEGDGVHVQMETFVNRHDEEYGVVRNDIQGNQLDSGAKAIDGEFKTAPY